MGVDRCLGRSLNIELLQASLSVKGCLLYSDKDGVFSASSETTCHLQ